MKKIYFNKEILVSRCIGFSLILILSIFISINPETFTTDRYNSPLFNRIISSLSAIYFLASLYSHLKLFNRKFALIIDDEYLYDYSSYESIGYIKWNEIYEINKKGKKSIEIVINKNLINFSSKRIFVKFLLFANNWNYKKSIIISTANLTCNRDQLYSSIIRQFKKHKKLHTT